MDDKQYTMKVVGRKNHSTSPENKYVLQETMLALRKGRGFIPKGIYRFTTHEEAQEWMLEQMVKNSPETQR